MKPQDPCVLLCQGPATAGEQQVTGMTLEQGSLSDRAGRHLCAYSGSCPAEIHTLGLI